MKIRYLILLVFFAFFLVSCGADDDEDINSGNNQGSGTETNDGENQGSDTGTNDDSLPDLPGGDTEEDEKSDDDADKTPESFCYSGGAILYEGDQQFKACPGDTEKMQKQLCKNKKWTDEGGCVSGKAQISAITFKMGCDPELEGKCPEDTLPMHEVSLSAYFIDKFEVTAEHFEACIAAGACTNDNSEEPHFRTSSDSDKCNIGNSERSNHPANCVTWRGADAYCRWIGKRLPTEAEWENAARAGALQIYPWGDSPEASCSNTVMKSSAGGCGYNVTFPVGSKPKGMSSYGVYDLSGNTAEYVSDWYDKKFYSTEEAAQKDPQGPAEPEKDKYKVIRGGSYLYGENHTRASYRSSAKLDDPAIDFGFRCASDN